jgi:hypothetical protein
LKEDSEPRAYTSLNATQKTRNVIIFIAPPPPPIKLKTDKHTQNFITVINDIRFAGTATKTVVS